MRSLFKRWLGGKDGVTAVEFAIVGAPFVVMTIGIVELSMIFAMQTLLHESTFSAARLIRTGQLQQSGGDQEQMFRQAVCDFSSLLIPCPEIQFKVQQLPSFADAADDTPTFDDDGNLQDKGFDPGAENDVVLIRVIYNHHVITPFMAPLLTNHGGNRTLMSTIVLQTEPYQ